MVVVPSQPFQLSDYFEAGERMTVAQVTAACVLTLMHWTREYWGTPIQCMECPHRWSCYDLVAWCEAFALDAGAVAEFAKPEESRQVEQVLGVPIDGEELLVVTQQEEQASRQQKQVPGSRQ